MYLSLQQDKPDDYFICSGTSIFLREIVEYVFDRLSINKNNIVIDPKFYRPVEILDLFGDNQKAQIQLKWNYNKTFFEVLDLLLKEELLNYK